MFEVEEKRKRVKKNLAISEQALTILDELTETYNSTEGRMLEALLETYGPGLVRERRNAQKE